MGRYTGDKLFKSLSLHKTDWPNKLYFYSPRLKGIPRFTASVEALSNWKESEFCETICPTQAIKVTASAIAIDDRRCIGCGLCVEFAPPGFLEMSSDFSPYVGLDKDLIHG
jgi:Fe-S-cluster-containing hydrogenase component 2